MPGALIKLLQDLVGSWLINLWVLLTTTTSPQVSIFFELRPNGTKTRLSFSLELKPFLRVLQHYNHAHVQSLEQHGFYSGSFQNSTGI